MNVPTLIQLQTWLSGEFDNRQQAFDRPTWFVPLQLWHRPLPILIEGNVALFAEQAAIVGNAAPYRQRIFALKSMETPEQFIVQYWAFKHPAQFQGAGANPALLQDVSREDLEQLPGCRLNVTYQSDRFMALPNPGENCYFQYQEKQRQVVLGFEVSASEFKSFDRGVDPETGQGLWGALMGPYEFKRIQT